MEFTHHAVCPFTMWNSVVLAHPQGCATLTMVLGHFCQPSQRNLIPSPALLCNHQALLLPASLSAAFLLICLASRLPRSLNPTRLPSVSPSSQGPSEHHSLCQCLLDILSASNIQNQPPAPLPNYLSGTFAHHSWWQLKVKTFQNPRETPFSPFSLSSRKYPETTWVSACPHLPPASTLTLIFFFPCSVALRLKMYKSDTAERPSCQNWILPSPHKY